MNQQDRLRLRDQLIRLATHRLAHSRRRYPTKPNLQYMDTVGYLIGILIDLAHRDSAVRHDLIQLVKKLDEEQ